MKKRYLFAAAVLAAGTLAGCSGGQAKVKTNYVDDLGKYIELGEYKGIEYVKAKTEVTDEDVDMEIQGLLQAYADYEHITEGVVADGDTVNINYTGMEDGVPFDGGTDDSEEGTNLTIGSGSFIDGFEEGLIGASVGDTVTLNLAFPEDYYNAQMAGAQVVFEVKVNYICGEPVVPEFDDAFVQEHTEYDTAAEYEDYIRSYLEDYMESSAEANNQELVWQQVMDNATITQLPQEKVDEEVEAMYDAYEEYAGYYGMTMEDFLTQSGMTEEDFRTEMTSYAEDTVKRQLVFYAIVEAEGLTVGEEEYGEKAQEMADNYGYETVEAMEEALGKDVLVEDMLWNKVLNLVMENAKAVESTEE